MDSLTVEVAEPPLGRLTTRAFAYGVPSLERNGDDQGWRQRSMGWARDGRASFACIEAVRATAPAQTPAAPPRFAVEPTFASARGQSAAQLTVHAVGALRDAKALAYAVRIASLLQHVGGFESAQSERIVELRCSMSLLPPGAAGGTALRLLVDRRILASIRFGSWRRVASVVGLRLNRYGRRG
jgi:hypothetical protein